MMSNNDQQIRFGASNQPVTVIDERGAGYALAVDTRLAGIKTPPTTVTIGVSALTLLAANNNRRAAYFYNNSANTIYLGSNSSVSTSNGIPLPTLTGFWDVFSADAWFAISASSNCDVRVLEIA